jgi:hypothetical protein
MLGPWCFRNLALVAGLLIAALPGCDSGPTAGEVRGKVTFKGQPVKEGMVTFLNTTEGGAFEGQIKSDGTYAVPNPVAVGEYVVEIKPPVVTVDTDPGKSPPAPVEKAMKDIPKKYRMQGTTPLKASVKAGPNELNFDMAP